MWPGTSLARPSAGPRPAGGPTCVPGEHGTVSGTGDQTIRWAGLTRWRKQETTTLVNTFVVAEKLQPNSCVDVLQQQEGSDLLL